MAMGREAAAEARKAVELDGDNPDVLLAAGTAYFFLGQFKKSHALLERAAELNPNNAMACAMFRHAQAILGRPDDGIELIESAMRLSPRDPQTYLFHSMLGFCHFLGGRFDDAIRWCERSSQAKPRYPNSWVYMAAALAKVAAQRRRRGRFVKRGNSCQGCHSRSTGVRVPRAPFGRNSLTVFEGPVARRIGGRECILVAGAALTSTLSRLLRCIYQFRIGSITS